MPFKIIRNDITKMEVDAIVNAANPFLKPGGGVCGAIFEAAGCDLLSAACAKIGHCDTGKAVCTKAFKLRAKYIFHTPGPIYSDGTHGEEELLYSCYKSCFDLAKKKKISSIAFPLISGGIYGYPKAEALKVAARAAADFLENNDMEIYLVVFDKASFEISSELFSDVEEYISRAWEQESRAIPNDEYAAFEEAPRSFSMPVSSSRAPKSKSPKRDIDDMLKNMDSSFSEHLLHLIDLSPYTDSQVYKRANIDRKLFSKIRGNPQYKPRKVTAVAFAIALKLDLEATRDLIGRAGFALTRSSKFDIIIEYFITRKIYDVFEINEVLFAFDQPLIGG